MPKHCPICGSEAVREEGEVASRCTGIVVPREAARGAAPLRLPSRNGHPGTGRCARGPAPRQGARGATSPTSYGLDAGALAELSRMGKKSAANVVARNRSGQDASAAPAALRSGNPARRRARSTRAGVLVRLASTPWERIA